MSNQEDAMTTQEDPPEYTPPEDLLSYEFVQTVAALSFLHGSLTKLRETATIKCDDVFTHAVELHICDTDHLTYVIEHSTDGSIHANVLDIWNSVSGVRAEGRLKSYHDELTKRIAKIAVCREEESLLPPAVFEFPQDKRSQDNFLTACALGLFADVRKNTIVAGHEKGFFEGWGKEDLKTLENVLVLGDDCWLQDAVGDRVSRLQLTVPFEEMSSDVLTD